MSSTPSVNTPIQAGTGTSSAPATRVMKRRASKSPTGRVAKKAAPSKPAVRHQKRRLDDDDEDWLVSKRSKQSRPSKARSGAAGSRRGRLGAAGKKRPVARPFNIHTPFAQIDRNEYPPHFETVDDEDHCECHKKGRDCSSVCENVASKVECPTSCKATGCKNQKLGKRQEASLKLIDTAKGKGVATEEALREGQFVIEYVGEVLTAEEMEQRQAAYIANNDFMHYFLKVPLGSTFVYIDSKLRGNISRCINHSCDPNLRCYMVDVAGTPGGMPRAAFFAVTEIGAENELTFDYQYDEDTPMMQNCLCGSANCRSKKTSPPATPSNSNAVDPNDVDFSPPQSRSSSPSRAPSRSPSPSPPQPGTSSQSPAPRITAPAILAQPSQSTQAGQSLKPTPRRRSPVSRRPQMPTTQLISPPQMRRTRSSRQAAPAPPSQPTRAKSSKKTAAATKRTAAAPKIKSGVRKVPKTASYPNRTIKEDVGTAGETFSGGIGEAIKKRACRKVVNYRV